MSQDKKTDIFIMPQQRKMIVRIILGTVLTTLGIVLVLPFTQYLSGDPRDQLKIRSVDTALPPPPPPPPEAPPPPPEEESQPEVDDIQQPPQQLSLSQLESALNPGMGGSAIAGNFSLDSFNVSADTTKAVLFFSLKDLDSRPKRLKAIPAEAPMEVRRRGLKGVVKVEVMIDEKGHVTVGKVVEATHEEMVQPVKQAVSRWIFEPPMKDGAAVKAKYVQPYKYDYSSR